MIARPGLAAAWVLAIAAAVGVRIWNAAAGPLMWGYDAWGHVAYVLFLDLYRAVPWADQGWSYFHPPLHYALGWALAQLGSGELLMRGLPMLAGAASLATAGLAAVLVRSISPGRPLLSLVAFGAVAFLPAHLFMSAMPGNELTETLLTAGAIAVFIANERRAHPGRLGDALAGAFVGLALLTKFSGLLPLLAIVTSLALRARLEPERRGALARAALVAAVAGAVAAPYYARNVAAFGTPFELSRGYPLVESVERDQPPGSRTLGHYFKLSPKLFTDPNPLAPHLLDSVWGSVYLNVWADLYRESDVARALEAEREERRSTTWMALLGLLPTGLAFAGAALAARDAGRGRRRAEYLPLLVLCVLCLGAFAAFAWRVPLWSALKSSYLLGLSLPFGAFLARAVEAVQARGATWQRVGVLASLSGVAGAAALVGAPGPVLPVRADAPATGAVRFYFGEYDAARRVYGRLIQGAGYPAAWLENLAAVELADGNAELAQRLYIRADRMAAGRGLSDPQRPVRIAVATALSGDGRGALAMLDASIGSHPLAEAFANRGAVRLSLGDTAGAEADLGEALSRAPEIVPAWLNLAVLQSTDARPSEARATRVRAQQAACAGPRGYPYGVGTGEVLEWGVGRRPLLLWEDGELRVALPELYRAACTRAREALVLPAL